MADRTLVLGIPLPNVSFDNHSFLSAPSLSEYDTLIVEMSAVSRAVDDVIEGAGVHSTFGGQAVVNGPGSSHAFPLADLLAMRRREAHRLLERGALVVCFAHPQVLHEGLAGDPWPSYSWLPDPEGFSYATDILPGFGRPGAVLTDAEHPFAPFVQALVPRLAYRATVNEDATALRESGRIFARSSGGAPIAFDIPAGGGRLVFLPALLKPDTDRPQVAEALVQCLTRWKEQQAPTPPHVAEGFSLPPAGPGGANPHPADEPRTPAKEAP